MKIHLQKSFEVIPLNYNNHNKCCMYIFRFLNMGEENILSRFMFIFETYPVNISLGTIATWSEPFISKCSSSSMKTKCNKKRTTAYYVVCEELPVRLQKGYSIGFARSPCKSFHIIICRILLQNNPHDTWHQVFE